MGDEYAVDLKIPQSFKRRGERGHVSGRRRRLYAQAVPGADETLSHYQRLLRNDMERHLPFVYTVEFESLHARGQRAQLRQRSDASTPARMYPNGGGIPSGDGVKAALVPRGGQQHNRWEA